MSLAKLYNLNEAEEKMISRQEVDRRWPGATSELDVDADTSNSVTFFTSDNRLFANIKSQGWFEFYPNGSTFSMRPHEHGQPSWGQITKPAQMRGGSGREPIYGFKGNPGSHQQSRTDVPNYYTHAVNAQWVAKHFGKNCLKQAEKLTANREFIFNYQFIGKQRKSQDYEASSYIPLLQLYIYLPVEQQSEDQEIENLYEWNDRKKIWEGPY